MIGLLERVNKLEEQMKETIKTINFILEQLNSKDEEEEIEIL